MMAVCGLSVALLVFTLRHEKPRWGFISPESVLYCLLGDSAGFVTFFILKDDFDIDDSMGFGFVTVVSFFIPFYYMDRRFRTSQSAVRGRQCRIPPLSQALFIAVLSGMLLMRPGFALFVRFSYWLPQIIFSALRNHERSVSKSFAMGSSFGQLLFVGALLRYHPRYDEQFRLMVPVSIWVAVQLAIVCLQDSLTGAFFLPRVCRRKRFDWKNEKPPEKTQCAICLEDIEEEQEFVVTPCRHWFHEGCLKRWMEEQPICPIDRMQLPPIDVEYVGP
jgi:hypothetical protein